MDDQGIISDRFQDEDEEIWQLVCFMFADEQYAVDIKDVQEVIRVQKITYVPQMPDFVLGVINVRNAESEAAEQVAAKLRDALSLLPLDKLWVSPDCGLKSRSREEAVAKLRAMAAGVKETRRLIAPNA